MTDQASQTARDAGFLTRDEMLGQSTVNNASNDQILGMDVVSSRIMPEGWFGLRTEKGVMCVGPKGSFWVPAFDLDKIMNKKFEL